MSVLFMICTCRSKKVEIRRRGSPREKEKVICPVNKIKKTIRENAQQPTKREDTRGNVKGTSAREKKKKLLGLTKARQSYSKKRWPVICHPSNFLSLSRHQGLNNASPLHQIIGFRGVPDNALHSIFIQQPFVLAQRVDSPSHDLGANGFEQEATLLAATRVALSNQSALLLESDDDWRQRRKYKRQGGGLTPAAYA